MGMPLVSEELVCVADVIEWEETCRSMSARLFQALIVVSFFARGQL